MRNFKEDLTKIKAFAFDVDGVLSHQVVPMFPNGEPMRMANIKDGYVLQLAAKLGYRIAIITGGRSVAVRVRYEALGISDIYMGCSEKMSALKDWMGRHGLAADEIAYMGDDMPDIPVLQAVGMPTCPADAADDVKPLCRYVSPFTGGNGCVRDIMEQVLRAQNQWGADHTW